MKSFATLNVGKQGVSKTLAMLESFGACVLQVLLLQELDLNPASAYSYVQDWKRRGFVCVLSSGPVLRAAIISREPIRKVTTPELMDAERAVFACREFEVDDVVQKFIIGSVYGHSGDEDLASALVLRALAFVQGTGLPWIVMGDFNLESNCARFQNACFNGTAHCMDSFFGSANSLPATRIGGRRRIDFGMSDPRVIPATLRHFTSVADHYAVYYEIANVVGIAQFRRPARMRLEQSGDDEALAARFEEIWNEGTFAEHLEGDDVDAAWKALSNVAERLLSDSSDANDRQLSERARMRLRGLGAGNQNGHRVSPRRL